MLKPGYILGNRYQVIKPLGQGGQSNVYLLKDLRLKGKKWVAKEMVTQYADPKDQSLAKRHFEQEANLLATLEHPNLPKVIDYFSQGGKHYLIMSYLKGEDLERKLKRQKTPFSEEEVAGWGAQIATVLYYLHRQKKPIIFRDIKPSNVMICQGQVKLIDFGIARHFNPSKQGDTLRIGSPGYSPPEQYSGQTDPRSDVFSLGVTMHQLLTKQDPAKTQSPFNLPPIKNFNPDVSDGMAEIITKSTMIDPKKRYQNVLDVKTDLKELLKSRGTQKVEEKEQGSRTVKVPDKPDEDDRPDAKSDVKARETVEVPLGEIDKKQPGKDKPPPPADQIQKSASDQSKETDDDGTPADIKELARQKAREILEKSRGGKPAKAGKKKSPVGVLVMLAVIALSLIGVKYVLPGILAKTPAPSPTAASSQSPPPPPSEIDLASKALEQNKPRKALSILKTARENFPGDPRVQLYVNNAWAALTSRRTVEVVIALDPANPVDRSILAGAAFAQQKANLEGGIRGRKVVLTLIALTGDNKKDREAVKKKILEKSGPVAVIAASPDTPGAGVLAREADRQEITLIMAGSYAKGKSTPKNTVTRRTYFAAAAALARQKGYNEVLIVPGTKLDAVPALRKVLTDAGLTLIGTDSIKKTNREKSKVMAIFHGQPENLPDSIPGGFTGPVIITSPSLAPGAPSKIKSKQNRPTYGVSPFYNGPESFITSNFIIEYTRVYPESLPDYFCGAGTDALNRVVFAARQTYPQSRRIYRFLNETDNPTPFEGLLTPVRGRQWSVLKLTGKEWKQTGGVTIK